MSVYVKTQSDATPISNSTEVVSRQIQNEYHNLTLWIFKYGRVVNYRISNYISNPLTALKTYNMFHPNDTKPLCRRYYTQYNGPSAAFDFIIEEDGQVSIKPMVNLAKGTPINVDVTFIQAA